MLTYSHLMDKNTYRLYYLEKPYFALLNFSRGRDHVELVYVTTNPIYFYLYFPSGE